MTFLAFSALYAVIVSLATKIGLYDNLYLMATVIRDWNIEYNGNYNIHGVHKLLTDKQYFIANPKILSTRASG